MTLRELVWMAEGRCKEAWTRASVLLALLANAHRDPKRAQAFRPSDFNPYELRAKETPAPKTKNLSILKTVFVDNPKPKGGKTDGR